MRAAARQRRAGGPGQRHPGQPASAFPDQAGHAAALPDPTAGLRDYLALCELAGIPVLGIGEDRAMDLITGQRELDFAPGSAFSYSNTGYVLAAAIVRRITGAGLARFASERVFGPLGMTATHFRDDVAVLVPPLAGGLLVAAAAGGVADAGGA